MVVIVYSCIVLVGLLSVVVVAVAGFDGNFSLFLCFLLCIKCFTGVKSTYNIGMWSVINRLGIYRGFI